MTTAVSTYYTTQIAHVSSGASVASTNVSASSDISGALSSTNLVDYPRADVALYFQHTSTLSSLSNFVSLYRRDINFDGSAGDEGTLSTVTTTYYKAKFMGAFQVAHKNATSNSHSQYALLTDVPLSRECEFYVENNTNANFAAGWTLKVTPKTDAVN